MIKNLTIAFVLELKDYQNDEKRQVTFWELFFKMAQLFA